MPNPNASDPKTLRAQQYQDDQNLNARIALHVLFSVNDQPWPVWVFEKLKAPDDAQVLEIGCGPGSLWHQHNPSIPPGWQLTLTDLSVGMVKKARQNIGHARTRYASASAPELPFPDNYFDLAVANHMLYHVPDLHKALSEIRRALKPTGRLYATTNGAGHMNAIIEIVKEFDPTIEYHRTEERFNLENGAAALREHFEKVEKLIFPDGLEVTQAQPLVDYILSMAGLIDIQQVDVAALRALIQHKFDQDGVIIIHKSIGMFVGEKS